MLPTLSQFRGCLLGLALGDASGAPFEGGVLERCLWRIIGRTADGRRRYTDDTRMALDIAESLIERREIDQHDIATRFAQSYSWTRGYGPGAARTLKRIRKGMPWQQASRSVYPQGSFGNGGAMRAPVIAIFSCNQPDRLADNTRASAEITHAHPHGIEGALIVAAATAAALTKASPSDIFERAASTAQSQEFTRRFSIARSYFSAAPPTPNTVRVELGTGILATESCVAAVYLASRFLDGSFADLLAFIAACGGDTDTLGAMAGAIWGAYRGHDALPVDLLDQLESREHIESTATELYNVIVTRDPSSN